MPKRVFPGSLSLLLIALHASFGQSAPSSPPSLQSYLNLTDDQLAGIGRINTEYNQWSFDKVRRVSEVQVEIVQETAKEPLDPMAIGIRYAELEAICRDAKDRVARAAVDVKALLTEAQRAKLQTLDEAVRLQVAIAQATSLNLLRSPNATGAPTSLGTQLYRIPILSGGIGGGIGGVCYVPFGGLLSVVQNPFFSGALAVKEGTSGVHPESVDNEQGRRLLNSRSSNQ